jgi:hypothetical protein
MLPLHAPGAGGWTARRRHWRLLLLAVALFLAVEVSSLLLGEAAAPEIAEAAREATDRLMAAIHELEESL